jgi:PAS domain S-box-containing protein
MPYIDYMPRLLIVDDDPVARRMLRSAAEEMDLFSAVADCDSSASALEALQQEHFDLLLLDYELDDLNGVQVFERAKHIQEPIAGILVTAHDEKEVIIAAIQAGIRDFLEKPIPSHILANSLQRAWDELEIRILLDVENRNQIELLETLPDIVYKIDLDGYIEYVNQAVRELGIAPEELIGKHITKIINAQDFHAHSLQTVLEDFRRQGDAQGPPRLVNERRSGQRRTQNLKIRLINYREGREDSYREAQLMSFGEISAKGVLEGSVVTGSLGIIRDITEREKQQQELKTTLKKLQSSQDALKAADQVRGRFLAEMSHEVRTPLNAINGTVDLLADSGLSEEQLRQLEVIRSSCRTLGYIVDDILDLSHIESNRFRLNPVKFNPDTLLTDVHSVTRHLPEAEGLEIRLNTDPDPCPELIGDAERIQQILLNLVHNALKHTDQGFVEITRTCKPVDKYMHHRLFFSVRDTGTGIPEERLESIFEHAIPGDPVSTRRYGTSGIGLPLSRKLARLMRGDIQAASQEGAGSAFTFTVVLPAADAMPEPAAEPRFKGPVLIAEDNMTNRLVMTGLLENMGVETDIAKSGAETVLKADGRPYSVIFMDVQMPGMDGIEAARRIRNSSGPNRNTFIVALTADVVGDVNERCRRAGMDEFLAKPVGRADIQAVLQRLETRRAAASPTKG